MASAVKLAAIVVTGVLVGSLFGQLYLHPKHVRTMCANLTASEMAKANSFTPSTYNYFYNGCLHLNGQ